MQPSGGRSRAARSGRETGAKSRWRGSHPHGPRYELGAFLMSSHTGGEVREYEGARVERTNGGLLLYSGTLVLGHAQTGRRGGSRTPLLNLHRVACVTVTPHAASIERETRSAERGTDEPNDFCGSASRAPTSALRPTVIPGGFEPPLSSVSGRHLEPLGHGTSFGRMKGEGRRMNRSTFVFDRIRLPCLNSSFILLP